MTDVVTGLGALGVLGLPRSGTTWLAKIFDSHPATLYRHEPDSGADLGGIPAVAGADADVASVAQMRTFLADLPARRSLKVCSKLPLFAKAYLPGWRGGLHRASIYAAKAAAGYVRLPVLEPRKGQERPPRVVWKSIESTGRAGLIAHADPSARLILCLRHPCGQIDSTLRGESSGRFTDATSAADDSDIFDQLLATPLARERGLTRAGLAALSAAERLAWRWLLFNEQALADLSGVANARVITYEDLCHQPMTVARDLFQFADLPWDPAVPAFIDASTAGSDERYYSVNRDPLQAANAWRGRLSDGLVARVEDIVRNTTAGRLFEIADRARVATP